MTEESKEISEMELPGGMHGLWLKAIAAVEMKNYKYSISLLQAVLKEAPGFLEGRKALRNSAIQETGGAGGKKKGFFGTSGGPSIMQMKLDNQGKKDPLAVLVLLEKELEKEPISARLNEILYDNAMRLNFLDTAAYALETVRKYAPENTKLLHKLAEHYMARDMPAMAEKVYNDIVQQDKTDIDATKGAKDASARASMKKQKWGEGGSISDMMKDGDEAADLEKSSQTGMTQEQLQERRDVLLARYEADPNDSPTVKKLAAVYENLEDWENSYNFYAWAYELSSGDNSLKQKSDFMADKFAEYKINQVELALAKDPENPELQTQLAEMKGGLLSKQIEEARKRVEMNPTDPQNRHDLGLALYKMGEYSEAIPHLQHAKRSPHIRIRVLLLLARTFYAKGMNDLALKQLEDANTELTGMDSTKKEILYEMGAIHASSENKEKALACFKQIYEVDYAYRDVAKRVEDSYEG